MSEPAGGTSLVEEICQHLAALTQAMKSLQEGYVKLEERVQNLTVPTNAASASSAAPDRLFPLPQS